MNGERDDGGTAFPSEPLIVDHMERPQPGMSLRDWFAGQALAGLLASDAHSDVCLETLMNTQEKRRARARFAYHLADAMLTERVT